MQVPSFTEALVRRFQSGAIGSNAKTFTSALSRAPADHSGQSYDVRQLGFSAAETSRSRRPDTEPPNAPPLARYGHRAAPRPDVCDPVFDPRFFRKRHLEWPHGGGPIARSMQSAWTNRVRVPARRPFCVQSCINDTRSRSKKHNRGKRYRKTAVRRHWY